MWNESADGWVWLRQEPATPDAALLTASGETTDAGLNIPTNLGAGTNEDRIIVLRSADVQLWTEGADLAPKMLRVDEPVSTRGLEVRLIAYDYSAFTAGRYPAAVCVSQVLA